MRVFVLTSEKSFYLSEYRPPAYFIERVSLSVCLSPTATKVHSRIVFLRNPHYQNPQDLILHGVDLTLINCAVDGQKLTVIDCEAKTNPKEKSPYYVYRGKDSLRIPVDILPHDSFLWQAEVVLNPFANTTLEGLYMSDGMYFTQCEAEGFRKITYYPDRPDVLAVFSVQITGKHPIMLSNGNCLAKGTGWVEWYDPFPKPSYLFALVAGDFFVHSDQFTTQSGRCIDLNIYVHSKDKDKCAYALAVLKRAMRWDEQVYKREYDLDMFNVVAVDNFNMGAMENKGLNIFNAKCVLASPETATDSDYESIETIIAHEYFHNWTGNRITCRDWFQLCLKEGLTVFRDQQFSQDMRDPDIERIKSVINLRNRQFKEDNSPLAHPVRPTHYVAIDNFYTATVYDKGAEIIRMLKLLVGDKAYDKAVQFYFSYFDGRACTLEDWLFAFEHTLGQSLDDFKRWYTQLGTPHITSNDSFENGRYTLSLQQDLPDKITLPESQIIPIKIGFLDQQGNEIRPTDIIVLKHKQQFFHFDGFKERPIASILRGFSAPVVLNQTLKKQDQLLLYRFDTDRFNQWQAGNRLACDNLVSMIAHNGHTDHEYIDALGDMLQDDSCSFGFRALLLTLPTAFDISRALTERNILLNPFSIKQAIDDFEHTIVTTLESRLIALYTELDAQVTTRHTMATYTHNIASMRALHLRILALLTKLDGGMRAVALFAKTRNMTQKTASLFNLLKIGKGQDQQDAFYHQWQQDTSVLEQWFALQVKAAQPDQAAHIADSLLRHERFDWCSPNKVRSVVGVLTQNMAGFHHENSYGYTLLANAVLHMDTVNPHIAARLVSAFADWQHYETLYQTLIKAEIKRIAENKALSRNTYEMVERMLVNT